MGAWEAEEYEGVLLSGTAARWTADDFCSSKHSAARGSRTEEKKNFQFPKTDSTAVLDHNLFILFILCVST